MDKLTFDERRERQDELRDEYLNVGPGAARDFSDESLVRLCEASPLSLIQGIRQTYKREVDKRGSYPLSDRQRWCLANWLAERDLKKEEDD